jgi:DUF1680 family protein
MIALAMLVAGYGAVSTPDPRWLQTFRYQDVRLTGGLFAAQAAYAKDYFLALNEDSLLQGFRQRAGLPAPGKPMGGWYDPEGFAAAHPFGQYISALARTYANTGDVRYKAKVARLVHGLHATMRRDGYFFASDKVAREWPCYIYDKYCTAMRDAYQLADDQEAMTVLARMTDWAFEHMPRRSDEWYTLPENLYKCYALTGDRRYLIMAGEYDAGREYADEFAQGKNAFHVDLHAYSHVNALASLAMCYEATGSARHYAALKNSWEFLTKTQSYASGGWGPDERFVNAGALGKSLASTGKDFETPCGTYANANMDRYLLRFTREGKYGDNMERVLYNGLLASLAPKPDGRSFYYSDYRPGATKAFFGDVWPCCSGTYAEGASDYPIDVYFHDDHALYVNLFTPSTVRWKGVQVSQTTQFPFSDRVRFKISGSVPTRFALNLRAPAWSSSPTVLVNGKPQLARMTGSFLKIDRRWSNGDVVELKFPMKLRFEPIDSSSPKVAALMYGPILLVALAKGEVALKGDPAHPGQWIARTGPLNFQTKDGVAFRPFFQISDERYTTYCSLAP